VTRGGRPEQALGRKSRPSKPAGTEGAEKREPLTRQKLEQLALSYVNRFDCTASKLTRHLNERVRKVGGHDDAALWISELVQRYQGSGVLDDARFAKNLSSQLTSRGKSARAISQKLSMRGVPSEIASELMTARKQDEPGAELEAARTYARKRRLGAHRPAEERALHHQKDLAALARQGFSFDIARKALGPGPGSDEEF
jgi:regulatory protein